jgi:tryptophan-rich sensory protein
MGIAEAVRRAVAGLRPAPPALKGARSALALAGCVSACFGAAAAGSFLSFDGVSAWYPAIAKPSWTPPAWLFGPVWSALYLMMGVAAWRVWRRDGLREARLSLGVFAIQLVFNAAWSGIFFGLRDPGLAFVEIMALWILVLVTTVLFSARDRVAAAMMLPYLCWVSFASVLNGAIAWMNRL